MKCNCGKPSTWCVPQFDCCPHSRPLQWCYGFYVTHQQGHTGFELFFKTKELKKKWLDQFEMAMWVCWHAARTVAPTTGTDTCLCLSSVCMRGIPRLRGVDSSICNVWSGLSSNQAHTVGKRMIKRCRTQKCTQTWTAPHTINTAMKLLCLCAALHTRPLPGISTLLFCSRGSFFFFSPSGLPLCIPVVDSVKLPWYGNGHWSWNLHHY